MFATRADMSQSYASHTEKSGVQWMKDVEVKIEFSRDQKTLMSWERRETGKGAAFELLGRAFEAAERETGDGMSEALLAFFRGALLRKGDIAGILERME